MTTDRRTGLGTMTLTGGYGHVDPVHAASVLGHALCSGVDLIDTADAYVGGEQLVAATRAAHPEHEVRVVTKIGLTGRPGARRTCGRPEYLYRACEASLRRLGSERLDVLLLHRVDPDVPVDVTLTALAELVRAGKVEEIGLCTTDPAVLQQAIAIAPVRYVEAPLSVVAPSAAGALLSTARDLGVTMLAYSPLGRGLVAVDREASTLSPHDARAHVPEFDPLHRSRAAAFRQLAACLDVSAVDLALGWIASLGPNVIAIPGARSAVQVTQNLDAQRREPTLGELLAVDAFVREAGVSVVRAAPAPLAHDR